MRNNRNLLEARSVVKRESSSTRRLWHRRANTKHKVVNSSKLATWKLSPASAKNTPTCENSAVLAMLTIVPPPD
jgi:hypothetical protein